MCKRENAHNMPKRRKTSDYQYHHKKKYGKVKNENKIHSQPMNNYQAVASLEDYEYNFNAFPKEINLGSMSYICQSCGAFMWKNEIHTGSLGTTAKFSLCCSQGKISLPCFSDPPELLKQLLTADTPESKHFRQHIRAYNSSFAFASLGVQEDILPSKGPYTFRINGAVYHKIGNIFPHDSEKPKFSQIYIYDTQNELSNRISWNKDLDKKITHCLQDMLQEHNPFVHTFQHAAEVFNNTHNSENLKLVLKADTTKDRRRYNLPTETDISIIIPNSSSSYTPTNRDIVLYRQTKDRPDGLNLLHINETNQLYDPLHYVLLFPYGDYGWSVSISHNDSSSRRVTAMNFYSYHLMQRQNFNLILRGGRLFHQYIVDQYAKIEQERLNYCLYHQKELRAELYQGLSDAVAAGDTEGAHVGRKIVLPSSFIGGPRNMHQLYQDAMAIVRHFGKPDLFITFTCNPKWPEILNSLLPSQTSTDRPDLISRVFHLKFKDLLHDIVQKQIFGIVSAYVYTIEFQKRGLPHAHILIILQQSCKPTSPDQYDKYVAAEIPNCATAPILYDIVIQHMIHGPCGASNLNSPCMENGKCTKDYPKQFSHKTVQLPDGYPMYKRPDNGVQLQKHGVIIDNRWIVPYNPYLSTKFSAHINVEICSTVTAVKYLYKYVYKGHDRIMAGIASDQDNEIQRYIDARYVSASEASWRIFHFELHDRIPAVQHLALHLPSQQNVVYQEGKASEVLQHCKDTTLTAWFKANIHFTEARSVSYHVFPEYFTWNPSSCTWTIRKSGKVIGRLFQANPSEGERFFLRILLHHTPGCTSYEDLRTLPDGTLCESFKQAALKRGLLQDDEEWIECLNEATLSASPSQIRLLFVTILIFGEPASPVKLWNMFQNSMSEDIARSSKCLTTDKAIVQKTLHHINNHLKDCGKSLKDFPSMPLLEELNNNTVNDSNLLQDELNYCAENLTEEVCQNEVKMNTDQKHIYETVIQSVISGKSQQNLYFIDGPGGTGKTFLYNSILAKVRSSGKIALAVASSGIAAELLTGGRTAHSRFKIPIPILESSTCNISKQSQLADLIKKASIIIWDEAPMMHRFVFECVHRTFCDLLETNKPFGGKVVLLGGDFRQILPVVRHGSQSDIIFSNLQHSFLWSHVHLLHLTINMRIHSSQNTSDNNFENYLLSIGNGTQHVYPTIGSNNIQLPRNMCIPPNENGLDNLIAHVYPDLISNTFSEKMYARAILSSTNERIDKINTKVMKIFPSEECKTYLSADTITDSSLGYLFPTEFLNSLTPSGLPPHCLCLKKFAPILLLRNLNPKEGLLNGTRLSVLHLGNRIIEAKIMTGKCAGNTVFLPRITLTPSDSGLPFQLRRRQFPVRAAFAMTINKSQGQTLDYVGIDLSTPVFTHGQLYVALSRVRSFSSISILTEKNSTTDDEYYTDNVVYKEVLI